jgi:hypothetical protein
VACGEEDGRSLRISLSEYLSCLRGSVFRVKCH